MCGTCYTSAYGRLLRQREKVAVNSTISCPPVTKQDKGKHLLRLNYRNADKRKIIKKNFRIILRNNLNYSRDIFTDTLFV
ncbi:hypothetical protein EL06_07830 [Salmonella enterica subsp. diarizonae]|uniref:Uncharacterized protein n=1 Tax=Salmonella diarizonae TaxID=59204 RepID=A0A6C8XTB4_SALDZ|nr:hypothetical protein [Salmonella enterica subsp. diarizonae]